MADNHTFHIPVMGTGYTIDTAIKVAPYGIDSVISIIDHLLIENMREYYCKQYHIPFVPISLEEEDSRAKRITAYLNLVQDIVKKELEIVRNSPFTEGSKITRYFEMLPPSSALKKRYDEVMSMAEQERNQMLELLRPEITAGAIDVNIMTKVDRTNFSKNKEPLPAQYNDAHASLRGFANSKLTSSVVFSAGMNPRLYGYIAEFNDFFPDEAGNLKKRIILKVSDYRSALIQGKFLAKKGLWISEFRIESGLNCGGHAFATEGHLMGPILNDFRNKREELSESLFDIYAAALKRQELNTPAEAPGIKITAQGGVGTTEEHESLLAHFGIDSVGWGTPFLLVPEVVNVDDDTLEVLRKAKEDELYLSHVSPLGIRFNTVKGSSGEQELLDRVDDGKPGCPCLKNYLAFNNEFTDQTICVASKKYQRYKIKELKNLNLSKPEFDKAFKKITNKLCLCIGLGNSLSIQDKVPVIQNGQGVAICPGPNMAYFNKIVSFREMVSHIYGRVNIMDNMDRPHMFLKELELYMNFLKEKMEDCTDQISKSQMKYFKSFQNNLEEGISYYRDLAENTKSHFDKLKTQAVNRLNEFQSELNSMKLVLAEVAYA
jgi:hypothetical protein